MSFVQRQLGGRKPISTSLSRTFSDPQVAGQHGRCPEETVAEPKKQIRTRAFKNTSPAPNVNKVDWATWLVSDIQDAGSDNDLDYKDIEEEEEADALSDNDLSDVELDHVETVCELCAKVSQAQVFVALQEQERKMLKDKIGILEQQLESLQKAAALEMSAREALESSAKEAIEQAAEGKKAVEAANIALAEAQRQLNWHQDQSDWVHTFYIHGGPPPPDVMRRMRKLCGL